ncbi:MAG TPA: DUF4214 domain-containing protein [Zeimonas sp.]
MAITVEMRTEVSQLYVALFGRAPDGEGLGFWVNKLDEGWSMTDVANTMYATEPARAYYPSFLTTGEIVASFYQNVLGRAADAEGLAFWTAKMNEPGATPGSVIAEMIWIVANYTGTDPAGLESAALFNNRVEVAQYYGEQNGSIAGAAAVLTSVTSDAATVDAAIAAIDSGAAGGGQSFTLTTGIDAGPDFQGGVGNDTFIANNDTWNVGDSLDGGAGTDTLLVANESEDLTLAGRTLTSIENLTIVNVDPDTGDQDFNFAGKALDNVTIDYSNTEHLQDVYLDNLRADTDLAVTNVVADGSSIYRNYDGVYSTLAGAVSQSNSFSNIDGSVNDYYVYFENYAYFSAATELNLTESWSNVTNGGTSSTGSDDSYAYSYNYVDLAADSAVVNVTYNLTDVVVPDGYSYLDLEVTNGSSADGTTDTVNVTYNLQNVDGIYAYVDTYDSGDDGETDTVTINANGVANSDGSNEFDLYYFETANINVTAASDLGDLYFDSAAADQTINIVAGADVTMGDLDGADDHAVEINISGAGNVTFDEDGDNEGLTVNAGTATGNLDLAVGSDAGFATVATLGSGNDTLTLVNAFELNADADAFLQVLDGGDGVDTFEIDTNALVTSIGLLNADVTDFSDAVKNFEQLSLLGVSTQDIDATTLGFGHVTIDGYTTGGSLTVANDANVVVTGAGTTDYAVVVDDAATGTDDSLTLTVNGTDGVTLAALTVADVETVSLVSSASDPDDTAPGANTVALVANETVALNVSGATELDLTGSSFGAIETVAAGSFDAGLTIDVSASTEAVTITTGAGADVVVGSAQNDVISVGDGGNTVTGGVGKDTINLGNGATADDVDTIVYTAANESQGVKVDVINGFQVDVQATTDTNADDVVDATDLINDILDFSGLAGLAGTPGYVGEANGYGAVLTSLVSAGGNTTAVLDSSTSTLYIDVDGSGTLDNADMAINLVGVTELSDANFAWA